MIPVMPDSAWRFLGRLVCQWMWTCLFCVVSLGMVISQVRHLSAFGQEKDSAKDEPQRSASPQPRKERISLGAKRVDLNGAAIADREPVPLWKEDAPEVRAYSSLLIHAFALSADALAKSARHDVTLSQLHEDPVRFRGEVVHVEGILKNIRRVDAPPAVARAGIGKFYEGLLVEANVRSFPMRILFPSLPDGMTVNDKMAQAVSFDGYFFKLFRYQTTGGAWRDAPLLIGRAPAARTESSITSGDLQRIRSAGTIATMTGSLQPVESILIAHVASQCAAWPETEAPTSESSAPAPPLRAGRLDLDAFAIEDNKPMPSVQARPQLFGEPEAYGYALVTAFKMKQEALARGARADLTFAHFWNEPGKYRGEPARVEGTLKRLRRMDPPRGVLQDGIRDLYEAWISNFKTFGSAPVCLIFTELPPGLEPGEYLNRPIVFHGYFFKRYGYEIEKPVEKKKEWHATLLFIGHKPVIEEVAMPVEIEDGLSSNTTLLYLFLSILGATIFFALGLAWWYRRGDQQVRSRLAPHGPNFFDSPEVPEFANGTPADPEAILEEETKSGDEKLEGIS